MALAERTARALDASGAQVVRAGARRPGPERLRPALLAPGLRLPRRRAGPWRVVHKLNQCGSAPCRALPPGPGRVLPRRPARTTRPALVVLAPDGAGRAAAGAGATTPRLARLHTPAYNMVAYPWAQTLPAVEPVGDRNAGDGRRTPAPTRASAPRPGCGCRATSRRRCACRRLTAPGRAHHRRQRRLRRPPQRETIRRPHRDRHGRLGVRWLQRSRPRRAAQVIR